MNTQSRNENLVPSDVNVDVTGVDMIFEFVHKRWNKKSDRIKLLEQIAENLNEIIFKDACKFTNPVGKHVVNPFKVKTDPIGRIVIRSMFPEVKMSLEEIIIGFDAFGAIADNYIKLFNMQRFDFGVDYFGTELLLPNASKYINKKVKK